MSEAAGTLAGIVIFHPEEPQLLRLVGAVAPDVDRVAIFANSPVPPAMEAALAAAAGATPLAVIRPGGNVGLGLAYDAFLDRARAGGLAFAFLLDQDSLPGPGTVPALARRFQALAAAGLAPALVGPHPVDPEGRPMRIARLAAAAGGAPAGLVPVSFAISSGSLVGCEAAAAVGPFRADFFIDGIDLEWCMRANAGGYSVWVAEDVPMDHRLGRGVIRLPFGLLLADQPPRRLYTYLRNQLAMLRLAHVPAGHKLRFLVSLPVRIATYLVRNGGSRACRRALRLGLADGLRGRLGPPADRLGPPA